MVCRVNVSNNLFLSIWSFLIIHEIRIAPFSFSYPPAILSFQVRGIILYLKSCSNFYAALCLTHSSPALTNLLWWNNSLIFILREEHFQMPSHLKCFLSQLRYFFVDISLYNPWLLPFSLLCLYNWYKEVWNLAHYLYYSNFPHLYPRFCLFSISSSHILMFYIQQMNDIGKNFLSKNRQLVIPYILKFHSKLHPLIFKVLIWLFGCISYACCVFLSLFLLSAHGHHPSHTHRALPTDFSDAPS